ncbi:MAG: ABC transporter substrate-binding protein [Deltaproteobacteria bacterium]|nr:ABC transporter substrate-binding protein [Deltaproteobacteria bacterium]
MLQRTRWQLFMVMVAVMTMLTVPFFEGGAAAAEKSPVKIGLVTWREGPSLAAGRLFVKAFQSGIKYINERGGILGGRKVVGVIAPQGPTGETAKAGALKLAMKERVKALIGPHWAMAAPAGLAVAKRYNLPFLSLQGGTWLYKQKYPATAIFAANAFGRTNAQIKWAEKKGFKRAVMVFSDIPYNHDVADTIKARWEKPGSPVKAVDFIWYTFGQTELKKELTKAVGLNPDLIWSEAWSSNVDVSLVKTLKELGYKGAIALVPSITREAVQKMPKEISEGVYVFKEWAYDPDVPENKAFYDYWMKMWGEPPDYNEEVIWSETVFVLLAMDKAGTEGDGTKEGLMKIAKAMHSLNWVGPHGVPVKLSEGGLALWERLAMTQIRNKEFVLVDYIAMTPGEWLPWLK